MMKQPKLTSCQEGALVHLLHSREQGISCLLPGMGVDKRSARALETRGYVTMTGQLPGGLHDVPRRQRAWSVTLTGTGAAKAAEIRERRDT
jgi:hypothetical protein